MIHLWLHLKRFSLKSLIGIVFRNSGNKLPEDVFTNGMDLTEVLNAKGEDGYIKTVPVGKFPNHHNGAHEVTFEDVKAMAANLKKGGTDLLFDFGHESLWNSKAPAAGWTPKKDVVAKEDGLYVKYPDWTPRAQEAIENKEYRYLSPAYSLYNEDKKGKSIGAVLLSVGLTNTPYMDKEIDHIGNSKINSSEDKMNKALLKFFGLPENSTEEQINAKLNSLRTTHKLAEDAGIDEILNSMKPADPPVADAPAPKVEGESDLAAKVNSLTETVNKMVNSQNEGRVEALVNSAITEGKIAPADKAIWLNSAKADYEGTKTQLDAKAKNAAVPGSVNVNKDGKVEDAKVNSKQAATDFFKEQGRK